MKNILLTGLSTFVTMVAMESGAVTTGQCPNSVDVVMKNLKVTVSAKQLNYDFGLTSAEPEEANAINESLKNVAKSPTITRSFKIDRRQNGVCTYRGKDAIEKAELYTKNSRTIFLFQVNIGPRGILLRSYTEVRDLSPASITFNSPVSLALAVPRWPYTTYDAGGSMGFIGQTADFKVVAR